MLNNQAEHYLDGSTPQFVRKLLLQSTSSHLWWDLTKKERECWEGV